MDARFRLPFGWRQCQLSLQSQVTIEGRQFVVTYQTTAGDHLLSALGLRWSSKLQTHFEYLPPGLRGEIRLSTLSLPAEVEDLTVRIVPWKGASEQALGAFRQLTMHVISTDPAAAGQSVTVKAEDAR